MHHNNVSSYSVYTRHHNIIYTCMRNHRQHETQTPPACNAHREKRPGPRLRKASSMVVPDGAVGRPCARPPPSPASALCPRPANRGRARSCYAAVGHWAYV